jgi:SPP1 gp7 family putative phage head morphogenesis protein
MDKTDPAVLQSLFGLPPEEAVRYLQSKGLRITFNWAEMLDEAHARAFTVAKAMRLDVLRDIRKGVLDALINGKTLRQFEQELTPLLQAKGWWGKQIIVDGQGQAQPVQLGSPRRLKTIYQTNLQSAYMAGRQKAQLEADAFPYLMYVAVMDGRTRPSHAALNGKIWRKDDPVWASIYPPNGFNCRCRTRALTPGQMKREGLVESAAPEIEQREVSAGTDSQTGEQFTTVQTGVRVKDARGRPITMWVDPGFNASPLAGHPMDEQLARKALEALGDDAGFEMARKAVTSATRLKAWTSFVQNSLESGIRGKDGRLAVQGQTMTVGILPLQVARAVNAKGTPFMPVMHAEDRLLIGRKSLRHQAAGNAPSLDQWTNLPIELNDATWYLERDNGKLIAIMDAKPDIVLKAVFASNGAADTVFHVSAQSVEDAVSGGEWTLIK